MAEARSMTGTELDAFALALETLAAAFQDYRHRTGGEAVLVGGGAVIVHIGGCFFSGDMDFVAADSAVMAECMANHGFVAVHRSGRLLVGWYHPEHVLFGFQQVSGPLFDGRAAPEMAVEVILRDGLSITVPAVEDLIADRLAQRAIASPTNQSGLLQAAVLFRVAPEVDWAYLERRTRERAAIRSSCFIHLCNPQHWMRRSPTMRRTILLRENWRRTEARARELGLDTPSVSEAMRNPGDRRTEAKRHLLAYIGQRAAARGLQPFEAR